MTETCCRKMYHIANSNSQQFIGKKQACDFAKTERQNERLQSVIQNMLRRANSTLNDELLP